MDQIAAAIAGLPVPQFPPPAVVEPPSSNPTNTALAQSPAALVNSGSAKHRNPPANPNQATGKEYTIFEGTFLETVLVNRLDGDFSGPVICMLTNNVYSQDRQHLLIPAGSKLMGETKRVDAFGQRRLAVSFHRLIMPDGYSLDLDRFQGLNQIGETGLKDQVNNHYRQIFGASIAIGAIGGLAQLGTQATTTGVPQSSTDVYRQGVAASLSESSLHVLDRFLNILPTITIREGHRVKVYLTQDLLAPDYYQHTMPSNI
jgi:type IV secretion system protein VirB10